MAEIMVFVVSVTVLVFLSRVSATPLDTAIEKIASPVSRSDTELTSFNGICRYGDNKVNKIRGEIVDEDNKYGECYALCADEVGCTAFTLKDDAQNDNCFLYENGPYTYGTDTTGFTCYIMIDPCAEYDGISDGNACCASTCGTCGGSGCSGRDGGASDCCVSGIDAENVCGTITVTSRFIPTNGQWWTEQMAPCWLST